MRGLRSAGSSQRTRYKQSEAVEHSEDPNPLPVVPFPASKAVAKKQWAIDRWVCKIARREKIIELCARFLDPPALPAPFGLGSPLNALCYGRRISIHHRFTNCAPLFPQFFRYLAYAITFLANIADFFIFHISIFSTMTKCHGFWRFYHF